VCRPLLLSVDVDVDVVVIVVVVVSVDENVDLVVRRNGSRHR
jgi:hypothetical protein